jgi:hypothetical protein
MAKEFKCIKGWARNRVGDVVENYMFSRYPKEIQQNHFVEIKPKKVTPKSSPKSSPKVVSTSSSKSSTKGSSTTTNKS